MKKKVFYGRIKGVDDKNFTVDVIVSTKSKDRDGDIIEPSSFKKHLSVYKKNPILLSSHSHQNLTKVIGKAESIRVTDDGLRAKFKYFTDEGNPEADWGFKLAKNGIAAFSVGFIAKKSEPLEKDEDSDRFFPGRRFTEVELLEVSQVTVPANPDATIRSAFSDVQENVYELAVEKGVFNGDDDEKNGGNTEDTEEEEEEKEVALAESVEKLINKVETLECKIVDLEEELDSLREKSYIEQVLDDDDKVDQGDQKDHDVDATEVKGAIQEAFKS